MGAVSRRWLVNDAKFIPLKPEWGEVLTGFPCFGVSVGRFGPREREHLAHLVYDTPWFFLVALASSR